MQIPGPGGLANGTCSGGLVEESVGAGGAKAAPAVALLVEGAIVTALIQGSPEAAYVARDADLTLVERAKGR